MPPDITTETIKYQIRDYLDNCVEKNEIKEYNLGKSYIEVDGTLHQDIIIIKPNNMLKKFKINFKPFWNTTKEPTEIKITKNCKIA